MVRSTKILHMLELVKMSKEHFESWNKQIWKSYRDELVQSGVSEADADKDIERNLKETMPDGKPTPNQFFFDVMQNQNHVGSVWLSTEKGEWYIYDIEVKPEFRGQGLGRKTMQAIETYVRSNGGSKIGLAVFGFNDVARKLYLSEGYEITRLFMEKKLP
jgi:ribosomal protein S18 acetylase RimI-like enzyme